MKYTEIQQISHWELPTARVTVLNYPNNPHYIYYKEPAHQGAAQKLGTNPRLSSDLLIIFWLLVCMTTQHSLQNLNSCSEHHILNYWKHLSQKWQHSHLNSLSFLIHFFYYAQFCKRSFLSLCNRHQQLPRELLCLLFLICVNAKSGLTFHYYLRLILPQQPAKSRSTIPFYSSFSWGKIPTSIICT